MDVSLIKLLHAGFAAVSLRVSPHVPDTTCNNYGKTEIKLDWPMSLVTVQAYCHWPITITAFDQSRDGMLMSHRALSMHGKGMGSVNVP